MKRYQIADLQVDMDVSGRTWKQAQPYAVEPVGEADMVIDCDVEAYLQKYPGFKTLEIAEYMGTGGMFARQLLQHNGFFLHSSAVILDGKAYLFSAHCGTGKSTHTQKWIRLFGAQYLNDDKPALRRLDGTWYAYGTPWSGKHDLSTPIGVPLGGIAFLQRGEINSIAPLEPIAAMAQLMPQTIRRLPQEKMDLLLPLVDALLQEVPIWQLTCRNDDEAAHVSRAAMTGGNAVCKR